MASLVCRVDSTRWPVRAACTAISAVWRSRISPTMMMSGSWRSTWRSMRGKGQADGLVDLVLVDDVELVLHRVFDGDDVLLDAARWLMAA
jgi:hypothetical protein